MKFGIAFANTGPYATAEGAVALAEAAEAAGFDSLWTVEHVLVPAGYESDYPYDPSGRMPGPDDSAIPDPLIWLAYLAARTTTIKLGTGILILPQRNPAVVAKEVATLDLMSGGRVLLGVGVGWMKEEFDVLGVPFDDRGARTDAYIGALRDLWGSETPVDRDDGFVSWSQVYSRPQPGGGSVPIVVGGHSKAAARRAGRLGDGFFPGRGTKEELAELIGTLRGAADAAGRDHSQIEISAPGYAAFGDGALEAIVEHQAMGVSRMVIPPLSYNPTKVADVLAEFGERIIEPTRD